MAFKLIVKAIHEKGEHSSNVATPIQRASNVQSVIRRFLDEVMAASEPPSSSCRRVNLRRSQISTRKGMPLP
nr:hypothetical protein [Tanacetum cinerariifolium]